MAISIRRIPTALHIAGVGSCDDCEGFYPMVLESVRGSHKYDHWFSGGAVGADGYFDEATYESKRIFTRVPVSDEDWKVVGLGAGVQRTAWFIETFGIDLAIVVWNEKTRGTRHTMQLFKDKRIPYVYIAPSSELVFSRGSTMKRENYTPGRFKAFIEEVREEVHAKVV